MPARKKSAPNLSEIARQHGITRETVRKWRDEGTDISDHAAVEKRIASKRRKPDNESLAEARRRKLVADADRSELLTKKERGQYIETATAIAVIALLDRHVELVWKSLGRELPGHLEGLAASQMTKAINDFVDGHLIPRFAAALADGLQRLELPKSEINKLANR